MADQPMKTENVAKEFDDYSRSYDAAVNDAIGFSGLKVDFFTKVKADYLIDLVAREVGPPSNLNILDVGCGVGNYHARLTREFSKVYGVDVSAESLKIAAERHPSAEYRHYGGSELPFEDASLDIAFAICVYHHIPLPVRAPLTREIQRVVKPGGIFIIFEHNPANPLTMRVVNNCPFDADAILLRPKETVSLMREARFASVEARHILTIPAAGKALRGIDQWFGGLPLGAQYYVLGHRE